MKIHRSARDLIGWDQPSHAPKLSDSFTTFDLKSYVRPQTGRVANNSSLHPKPQVETHPGGTRWNPTQEQIEILEFLYKGGMRTPNAHQIEQITERLSKHGKIEGKNVFYWFQNHKARERQKLKRNSSCVTLDTNKSERGRQEESVYKRKCRSWTLEEESTRLWSWSCKDNDGDRRTLELFPLHPEGRS